MGLKQDDFKIAQEKLEVACCLFRGHRVKLA